MTCRGICTRFKAPKPVGTGRYAAGQKRCQVCEVFLKHEGLWCPCCGYRVRNKPRNLKYKAKLRERTQTQIERDHNAKYPSDEKPNRKELIGFDTKGNPILRDVA